MQATQLMSGKTYFFDVTVSKGPRNASSSSEVLVQSGSPPGSFIDSVNSAPMSGTSKYNPTDRLVVRGGFVPSPASPNEQVALAWTIRRKRDRKIMQILAPGFLATDAASQNLVVSTRVLVQYPPEH